MIEIENKGLDKLKDKLNKTGEKLATQSSEIQNGILKIVANGANNIRNTMIQSIQRTPRKTRPNSAGIERAYGASFPLNPPATQSGQLVRSILWKLNPNKTIEVGVIGGTQAKTKNGTSYAIYLEEGTKKMVKRPFLKPAVEQHIGKIIKDVETYTNNALTIERD